LPFKDPSLKIRKFGARRAKKRLVITCKVCNFKTLGKNNVKRQIIKLDSKPISIKEDPKTEVLSDLKKKKKRKKKDPNAGLVISSAKNSPNAMTSDQSKKKLSDIFAREERSKKDEHKERLKAFLIQD
jgi:hypothetical protein